MRVLAAMMKHETNSFSPVRTDLSRFADWILEPVWAGVVDAAFPDLHFPPDGEGVATSDNRVLAYRRLRRPIFPLDPAAAIAFPPAEG